MSIKFNFRALAHLLSAKRIRVKEFNKEVVTVILFPKKMDFKTVLLMYFSNVKSQQKVSKNYYNVQ